MRIEHVSERELFTASSGLTMGATLRRTLAHCLYWMQHATHTENGSPIIWKTGPELASELGLAARSLNRHLKELASRGYWEVRYRPKPGGVGNVTWLRLLPHGERLIELAQELKITAKITKRPGRRQAAHHSRVANENTPGSQHVTSKQTGQTKKTAKGQASFLLSGKAKKEALISSGKTFLGDHPRPPRYIKVASSAETLANVIFEVWKIHGLKPWDWSSRYTWTHLDEIAADLHKCGLGSEEASSAFLSWLLENWSWIRSCLDSRYSGHRSNLHGPSPMALAHEFEHLLTIYEAETRPPDKKPTFTSLEEGF